MVSVNLLFIFIASISFLGFIINSLFDKIRLTSIVPLLIIGLLAGPVFGIISTGPNSIITELTPIISAIAVSFILFDAGINIHVSRLTEVFKNATAFTLICAVVTGIAISAVVYFVFHFSLMLAFIFGFAAAGPGGIGIPMIMKSIKIREDLKTALVYESVASGVVALLVPLVLINVMLNGSSSVIGVSVLVGELIFGSISVGGVSALFWLFLLNRFPESSEAYSWILTVSMVIATYAVAQYLSFNGAIAAFMFGIVFGALGSRLPEGQEERNGIMARHFGVPYDIVHVRNYQKEIVFFTSTFFFVFMGLLFQKGVLSIFQVIVIVLISLMILPIRAILSRMLKAYTGDTDEEKKGSNRIITFSMLRDLSPAIIVTVVASYGLAGAGFVNDMFMILLATNIISAIGIMIWYKPPTAVPEATPA